MLLPLVVAYEVICWWYEVRLEADACVDRRSTNVTYKKPTQILSASED